MKRNTITIQINYNSITLYINKDYKKYNINSLTNYKITNKHYFIEELTTILDENKINNKLLTDNINIIIDKTYTEDDKTKLNEILKELSFNNIKYINTEEILHIKDKDLIINVTDNNIKMYHQNNILDINTYYNKHLEILSTYIKELIIIYKVKNIKLYGTYKQLHKIVNKLERKVRQEVYIYTKPDIIPIRYFVE